MHIPFVIIGGGVVGLSIAYEIRKKYPKAEIALFEKEPFLGEHSTHRNSAVLHAGIYYETGSLKHRLCLEGNEYWHKYEKQYLNNCGKYIVSTSDAETLELEILYKNGLRNGVEGLSWCEKLKLEEIKEFISVEKAFFSTSTSILDVPLFLKKLEVRLQSENFHLLKNQVVKNISYRNNSYFVETDLEILTCDFLINAAGLGAIDIRKKLGLTDLENQYVKGCYLKLNKKYYNKSLIYPVPLPGLKGLGVHTSFGADGLIRFGPNTEIVGELDYSMPDNLIESMYSEICKVFKNISIEDLEIDYCGIRPKIKLNGNIYSDFWIKEGSSYGFRNYIELCGIESPGLTSAPAIAKYVTELIESHF